MSVGRYDSGLFEYTFNAVSCPIPKSQYRLPFENDFFLRCSTSTFSDKIPGCLCENLQEGITTYSIFHGKLFGIFFDFSSPGYAAYVMLFYLSIIAMILLVPVFIFINHYRMRSIAVKMNNPEFFFKWNQSANSYNLAIIATLFGSFLVYSNIQSKTTINIFGQSIETSVPGLALIFLGFLGWFIGGARGGRA